MSCTSSIMFTYYLITHHLSLNCRVIGAKQMISQPFSSIFLCFPLPSWTWRLRPVHFLMLSSHLFLCLPCLRPRFTAPCRMVLARPDERETCPYKVSLCTFTMVRRISCGPNACWILAQTSSLITWSLYEICSMLRYHFISMARILLCRSAARAHDSQAYRKMNVTRRRISRIF